MSQFHCTWNLFHVPRNPNKALKSQQGGAGNAGKKGHQMFLHIFRDRNLTQGRAKLQWPHLRACHQSPCQWKWFLTQSCCERKEDPSILDGKGWSSVSWKPCWTANHAHSSEKLLQTLQCCPSHVHDRACCKYQPDRRKMIKPNPKPALIWNALETEAKHQSHSAFGAPGIRYATCPQTVWDVMDRLTWNWAAMTCVHKRTSEIPSRSLFCSVLAAQAELMSNTSAFVYQVRIPTKTGRSLWQLFRKHPGITTICITAATNMSNPSLDSPSSHRCDVHELLALLLDHTITLWIHGISGKIPNCHSSPGHWGEKSCPETSPPLHMTLGGRHIWDVWTYLMFHCFSYNNQYCLVIHWICFLNFNPKCNAVIGTGHKAANKASSCLGATLATKSSSQNRHTRRDGNRPQKWP